jgi:hypothetical protein
MRNCRSWCDYRIRLVVRYVIDAPTTTALLSFPLFRELEAYLCKGPHINTLLCSKTVKDRMDGLGLGLLVS